MTRLIIPGVPALPRKRLPACIAVLLAINTVAGATSGALANSRTNPSSVHTIANCDDSGAGSLRDAVENASNGDVIDLTHLSCSQITLANGELSVLVNDLTLLGPGIGSEAIQPLTIYGLYDRILNHGVGTLTISGLKLAYGHYQGIFPRGGCIYSRGSLVIANSIVTGCEVDAPYGSNAMATGGAIYAHELWMQNSAITNNVAYSATQAAYGGGVFAISDVSVEQSTVADNKVIAPQASAVGGGLMVEGGGDVNIVSSTISGNQAEFAGGLRIDTFGVTQLVDSTLSGNNALYVGAAHFSNTPVNLTSSTVTRNTAYGYSAAIYSDQAITAQSSIIADNRNVATDVAFDICAQALSGAANLITASCNGTPADTITNCPRLTALGDYGGPTLTHALLPTSPGIDKGSNIAGLVADQRGVSFSRMFGPSPDIGAYEWQGELGDNIFKSAFEIACDEY